MKVLTTILIGFASSILSGMFGIGGAGLSTPALRVVLHSTPEIALGTPLPVVIPTAISGALTYNRKGLLDWKAALLLSAGGIGGSALGAYITRFINLHYLMLVTGVVVLYMAYLSFREAKRFKKNRKLPPERVRKSSADNEKKANRIRIDDTREGRESESWKFVALGFLSGFYSGLLGLGGGIVLVPAMLFVLKMPIKKAFGTSLAVIAVIAIPGTVIHSLLGHVSGSTLIYLIVGVIPGAFFGAKITIKANEAWLYSGFGFLVMVFGIIFIVNEIISMVH